MQRRIIAYWHERRHRRRPATPASVTGRTPGRTGAGFSVIRLFRRSAPN